jgi:hypothetical protein
MFAALQTSSVLKRDRLKASRQPRKPVQAISPRFRLLNHDSTPSNDEDCQDLGHAGRSKTLPSSGCWAGMTYDSDATRVRLMKLKELTRYTTLQERAQLLKAIRLLIRAHEAIAELHGEIQHDARAMRQHNWMVALCRQMEAAVRRGKVCISDDDIPK